MEDRQDDIIMHNWSPLRRKSKHWNRTNILSIIQKKTFQKQKTQFYI